LERLYIIIKLKDGREIRLQVYEYMGRIFSEGFGFKKYLKIKDGKAIYKLWEKEEYDNLEDFCMFCNSLITNIKVKSSLYLLNDCYFLHIKLSNIKDYFRISTFANEYSNKIYSAGFTLDENSEIIIKNCAIETCRKYFV
jgi:hypothetical protein